LRNYDIFVPVRHSTCGPAVARAVPLAVIDGEWVNVLRR
jgi:hypothetical protein